MTDSEREYIEQTARSRTAAVRQVEHARIIQASSQSQTVADIASRLQFKEGKVRKWISRFNTAGVAGLEDRPRAGSPVTYPPEAVSEVIATALTDPQTLGFPFASWTLDRLAAYLNEVKGLASNAVASTTCC